MRLGLLIIGTELLQGKIVDANTVWLAKFLHTKQVKLDLTVTVSDDASLIKAALDNLFQHADLVFVSGGLGPTLDDITKSTLADYFGKTVIASESAIKIATQNYQNMGREFPSGHGYGFLPEDFSALSNPTGFAPGLWYSTKDKSIFSAPGVPREFQTMVEFHFKNLVEPLLRERTPVELLNFRTWGVPEEKIFNEVDPTLWKKLEAFGSVSSLPHVLGVDIGVTLSKGSASDVQAIIHNSPIAPHVWHSGFESLEAVILNEAKQRKFTFSFAESCTGGLCSHRMTNLSGSSEVFWGGVVSYDNSVKQNLLGVKVETLQSYGAVSEQTAIEMALGVKNSLKTDIAISLTGIAGPGGGSEAKPVGTVCIGIASKSGVRAERFNFRGDRETLKLRFSQIALFKLLAEIRN